MSGFFSFDTALPDARKQSQQPGGFQGFAQPGDDFTGLGGAGAGEVEDLAVYQWGEGAGGLLETGDDFNDETFGDAGGFDGDFQFSSQPQQTSSKPRVASTRSHFGPKAHVDLFAATEDDFYSSRPTPKKSNKTGKKQQQRQPEPEPLWAKASPANAWGAAPAGKTHGQSGSISRGAAPPQQILSLDEIEAEMSRTSIDQPRAPPRQQVLSLEEIESQLVGTAPQQQLQPQQHQQHQQPPQQQAWQHQQHQQPPAGPTPPPQGAQITPPPAGLPDSGYAKGQALLDSMFPDLGSAPPPQQHQQQQQQHYQGPPPEQRQPSPEELARMEALHQRISAKIEAMSKHNNLMGNSDKDFITRIQLSQLASSDPYSSDFYAQVYSALVRRREAADGNGPAPTVVQVAPGLGFGVGGAAGNRFGKMGTSTMQRLNTQVKKLVSTTAKRQANMSSDALQGALGRVPRRGATQAAPRPVLAVPQAHRPEHRPVNVLNQSTGVTRPALTRKQVMFALEELYDDVLELEQMRRDAPPPTDVHGVEAWNAACAAKVEGLWTKLMVMEPLTISNPHPFISLINPLKGQRLFPRLLRHLPQQQALTLLTLLIATYPQLNVVARAPPPPVADSSMLTKADRLDRAQREAETDSFLHNIIPGVDMLINQCNLGLVSGLLGIVAQRMEVWKVASTRPGVALFTALLSRAQTLVRAPQPDPNHPDQPAPVDPAEVDQWNKTFAYLLHLVMPHLPELFPSSQAQKFAFGPGAYLLGGDAAGAKQFNEKEGMEMERREAETWAFAAALAVNAPEGEQTNLVAALREKILHTVQAARDPHTPRARAELKLRNVNMFLHGLGLDASMIE
ncbi:DNA topoisomerase 2-associated protein pat1 [Vanrija albida]|uniref:DNA topoisomerase 2-associated protein pat1 n=1 Tax=Vanrija albida TaxID=181172 RepID=A0ABR3Q6K4_9TREE